MDKTDTAEKRFYVVRYYELIFLVAVFATILVLLYPKELIRTQVLNEGKNLDLSIVYLNYLIKQVSI